MPALAIEIDKDKLRDFCRKFQIAEFALFGSVTRPEEFRDDSDVDVLIRFAKDGPHGLDQWLSIREELATIFGREVDVVERAGVEKMRNYLRRDTILTTAVLLDVA
jgi:predicted nucleotidyltransferase